jgi:hypothetical protein
MFARKNGNGNYNILDNDGFPITRIDGVQDVYPVGSTFSCDWEHSNGIELFDFQVKQLGIEVE